MTGAGGANNAGTVFKITPTGTLTTLYDFCSQPNCTDGANCPFTGGLVQATDGNFYGITALGGANANCNGGNQSCGTVFKINPTTRALTTLHSFDGTDGSFPNGLVQATDGNFYGTAQEGGANGGGTVFKITPGGTLTTLYNFCSQTSCTDGSGPMDALIQAIDGNFYGTTWEGTVFKITPAGKLTTLATVGGYPSRALVQATDGNFYGTTARGGTIFKMTPEGKLTTLGSTCCYLYAGLVQATDGNSYGTTYLDGGAYGEGSVYEITQRGTVTTLYSFCAETGCPDGAAPIAGLVQGTDGTLYGTTLGGGASGDGTIFSLSVGLGPFVETLPTSRKVGAAVKILGNNLKGSTSITFNGTPATVFTVNSTGTAITTTVPSGATTGKVKVTTPSRTLTSNVKFRVTPTISSFSPASGPVGTSVVITGESFTGATSVTFGGVKATSFTVDSDTQITATVPTGAKTGKIGVATPGGTATSTGTFTVT